MKTVRSDLQKNNRAVAQDESDFATESQKTSRFLDLSLGHSNLLRIRFSRRKEEALK